MLARQVSKFDEDVRLWGDGERQVEAVKANLVCNAACKALLAHTKHNPETPDTRQILTFGFSRVHNPVLEKRDSYTLHVTILDPVDWGTWESIHASLKSLGVWLSGSMH
jgi:hypothetical protein